MKANLEQIAKLPKWAQQHIKELQMERDVMFRELKKWKDEQTPSPIRTEEHVCDGEQRGIAAYTRYIQGYRVQFEHGGVNLEVTLRDDGDNGHERIELQWSAGMCLGEVAMIPESFQKVRLQNFLRKR